MANPFTLKIYLDRNETTRLADLAIMTVPPSARRYHDSGNTNLMLYIAENENGSAVLCAATGDLTTQIKRALWNQS